METRVEVGAFAGKPMLIVFDVAAKEGDKSIIQFGVKKAEAILASIDEIKKFVEDNKK